MSGFDTGEGNTGIIFRGKQHGSILRGFGNPVPQAGVTGDIYIDNVTFHLFEKRQVEGLDDWGHYLFSVPTLYQTRLKWFGASPPSAQIGIVGDYFMQWAGYPNYGMQPIIWGPKTFTDWPENGNGPGTIISGTTILPIGLLSEGTPLTDTQLTQLIAEGLLSEYIIPVPVTANSGDPILELGLQSSGSLIPVSINSLYTAEDELDLGSSPSSSGASGVFTLNTAGVKTTADLLAAAGLLSSFTTVSVIVNTAPAGITIAQGAGSVVYPQGASATFNDVSVSNGPITLTLASGDVVYVLYLGN